MKKIFVTIFLFAIWMISYLFLCITSISFNLNRKAFSVSASYTFDIQNLHKRIAMSDNVFIAEIIEVISVMEYDLTGVPVPYTVYEVEVTNNLKGHFDLSRTSVTYYGGIINNQIITLNAEYKNNMELVPVLGEYYLFSTTKVIQNSGRLVSGMNIASFPYSAIWIDNPLVQNRVISDYQTALNSIGATSNVEIEFEDGGAGSVLRDGTSISKAFILEDEYTYYKTFSSLSAPIYFTFTLTQEYYIDIFSANNSSNTDVSVSLFTENMSLITMDDNSGVDTNFQIYYLLPPGKYYIRVINVLNTSGGFNISFNREEVSHRTNQYVDLVTNLNSVNVNNQIVFVPSNTFEYNLELQKAILLWNNLESVDIINGSNTSTNPTLYVSSFYENNFIDGVWSNGGYILVTPEGDVPMADLLQVNSYYFNNYTPIQITRIIAHEFGHALGLHEFNKPIPFSSGGNQYITSNESPQNIMRQMNLPLQQLGPCDIDVYHYLWG